MALGTEVVVYANGESRVSAEVRSIYEKSDWPVISDFAPLKEANHCSWAMRDASESCDIVHLNSAIGLTQTRDFNLPVVYTMHHSFEPQLQEFYSYYPDAYYVAISEFQRKKHTLPFSTTIHHGISPQAYILREKKDGYLCFLGRIAPVKGTHLAIEVARRSGIPLKIAGEVQPIFRGYFESQVKPHIDGKFIEYVGEMDADSKNELLGGARAMLFPIQWDEPFGLVMVESMACGTPVLALPGGSVPEVINDATGHICATVDEMVAAAKDLQFDAASVRTDALDRFSVARMAQQYAELYSAILNGSARTKYGAEGLIDEPVFDPQHVSEEDQKSTAA